MNASFIIKEIMEVIRVEKNKADVFTYILINLIDNLDKRGELPPPGYINKFLGSLRQDIDC